MTETLAWLHDLEREKRDDQSGDDENALRIQLAGALVVHEVSNSQYCQPQVRDRNRELVYSYDVRGTDLVSVITTVGIALRVIVGLSREVHSLVDSVHDKEVGIGRLVEYYYRSLRIQRHTGTATAY